MEARQARFMYDNRLSPMARIYLSEVYKYYQTPVDCLVDDVYFATLFKVDERQVRRWRTELKQYGYIKEETNRFGKKVSMYEPDINNHYDTEEVLRVRYITKNGGVISTTIEAFDYFDSLIESSSLSRLPKSSVSKFRSFCHIFANSLFDERYYNIKPRVSNVVLTEDFYQFVIEHFSIDIVYTTALRVMNNYQKIQNLNLYVLSAISNLYKGDYELFTQHPSYTKYRERLREYARQNPALPKIAQLNKNFKGDL